MVLDQHADVASPWIQTPGGLMVPEHCLRRPIAVDLFAGAGGFSLGFHEAGYHVIGAVELDYNAITTYAVNLARPGMRFHFDTPEREAGFEKYLARYLGLAGGKGASTPRRKKGKRRKKKTKGTAVAQPGLLAGSGWISGQPLTEPSCEHIWVADVRNLRGADMLRVLGIDEVDAVMGGPPCQGFSTAGKRDVMDPRNSLVFEFLRLAMELRAKAICMENVPAMLSMVTPEGLPLMDAVADMLEHRGYGPKALLRKALGGRSSARAFVRRDGIEPEVRRERGPRSKDQLGLFEGPTAVGIEGDDPLAMDDGRSERERRAEA